MISEIVQFNPIGRPDLPAVFLGQDEDGMYVVSLVPQDGQESELFRCMSLRTALFGMSKHVEDMQVRYQVNG